MKKRFKHNYTSELELKCLLIRIKNRKMGIGTPENNNKINKYVKCHTAIGEKKYSPDKIQKKNALRSKLKAKAIELSIITSVDEPSYEKFGKVILLMISKILTKPNFSGYTYRDDFYSDAVHKIFKYYHNFDHTMISDRTNVQVNAFAYVSQIIHNSVVYIINTKKKELDKIKHQMSMEILDHNLNIKDYDHNNKSTYQEEEHHNFTEEIIHITKFKDIVTVCEETGEEISTPGNLISELSTIKNDSVDYVKIYYPHDYEISIEEYYNLKPFLKGNMSIIRTPERTPEKKDNNDSV